MLRRIFTDEELEALREAEDCISMAREAAVIGLDRIVENVVQIAPIPPAPAPFWTGGSTLLSQAQ